MKRIHELEKALSASVEREEKLKAENEGLRRALKIVQSIYSFGYKQHLQRHKQVKELDLCVWCQVEKALIGEMSNG